MSQPGLKFEDVKVVRGDRTVLQVPHLELPPTGISVLEGDNGAGKSTLLLAAAGLLDLARGRILWGGIPVHQDRAPAPKSDRRYVGMVFQDPYLFRNSALENVAYGLRIRGGVKDRSLEQARAMLKRLGIAELGPRPARELSGGECKLVALARALVLEPRVLLLDEVTANLDEEARARLLDLIGEISSEGKTSLLLATHHSDMVERLNARRLVIRDGLLDESTALQS